MSEAFIPYGQQWLDEEDVAAVVAALRSDFLTTGPLVERFEKELAHYMGAGHAVVVNSGTSALHAAYHAAGLGLGDEIITSPLTFVATANAARYLGAHVTFVDVQPDTGNLDPGNLSEAIGEHTKLIVPVDFAGHPADYADIAAIARDRGLRVVADAAHSLGAAYQGRKVGTLADLSVVSFHPVKAITTAEGGAVLTDSPEWARAASEFRTHGITRDPGRMNDSPGPWYYEMQALGFNYRLSDVHCALGISQLAKAEGFIRRRRQIAALYDDALGNVPELLLPQVREGVEPAWHLYVARVTDPARRLPFFVKLRALGLGVQVHYIPVHLQPYYRALGYRRGQFPHAEDFYARAISLPLFPRMSDGDVQSVVERVVKAVREVL